MTKAKNDLPLDGVTILAHALAMAWVRYEGTFKRPPNGTPKQLAALVALAGGNEMLIRLGRAAEVAKMARGMRKMARRVRGIHHG